MCRGGGLPGGQRQRGAAAVSALAPLRAAAGLRQHHCLHHAALQEPAPHCQVRIHTSPCPPALMNLDPLPHLDIVVIRVSGIAEVSVAGEPGRETHFLAKFLMKIAQI